MDSDFESDLYNLATEGLRRLYQDEMPGAVFSADWDIVVNGRTIEVCPWIENSSTEEGKWHLSVIFNMRIDGRDKSKFSSSTFAFRDSKEEALSAAIQDWLDYFGKAFVALTLQLDRSIDVEGFVVYPGGLSIRGQSTEKAAEVVLDFNRKALSALAPVLSNHMDAAFPTTLKFTIYRHDDGTVEGDCGWDGAEGGLPGLALVSHVPWTTDESWDLVRQFFIITRK